MKNFLLYLGNDRAGSTWLHSELNKRTDCNFPEEKELYFFQPWFPVPVGFDKQNYFDTMASLVQSPETILTGDMTPINAYASKEELILFRDELNRRGFRVLPVMTLRDPISHAISLAKLYLTTNDFLSKNNNDHSKIPPFILDQIQTSAPGLDPSSVEEVVGISPVLKEIMLPWEKTVENVEDVFGKIHFNFYETLFNEQSIKALLEYLEIPYMQMDLHKKVFTFGEHPEFSDDQRQEIFEQYTYTKENYSYAVNRFGKEFIESIWWTPDYNRK